MADPLLRHRVEGPPRYAWALLDLDDRDVPGRARLLIRRNAAGEYAFYRCYSPTPVPISALVAVAGRWTVEENLQQGKELAGLDSIKFAAGPPGTAGPSWPFSPTRSSPSPPQLNMRTPLPRPRWSH